MEDMGDGTNINDTMDASDVMENTPTTNYIFYATNLCRLIFYTPIILGISIIGSVIYDYIVYKDEEEDNSKKSE